MAEGGGKLDDSVFARRALRVAALVVLAASLFVAVGECLGRPVGIFDESLYYVGAMLMARGERVHVDFHSSYLAPNFQLLAWTFRLLGESAYAARILHCVLYLGLLGGLWFYYRKLRVRSWALAPCLIAAVVLGSALPSLPSFPAVASALLSFLLYLHATIAPSTRERRLWLAAAGVLAALTLLQRIAWGGYVGLTLAFTIGCELLSRRRDGWDAIKAELSSALVLGSFLVATLLLVGLTLDADLGTMLFEIVSVPATAQRAFSMPAYGHDASRLAILGLALPLFCPVWLLTRTESPRARTILALVAVVLVPLLLWTGYSGTRGFHRIAYLIWLLPLAHQLFARPLPRTEFVALSALAVVSQYYFSRPDFEHLVPSSAPIAFLLPLLFVEGERTPSDAWKLRLVAAMTLAVSSTMVLRTIARAPGLKTAAALVLRTSPFASDAQAVSRSSPPLGEPLRTLYGDENENAVARFVREKSRERDAVYVGLSDHSRTFVNDMRLYFLIGRRPGARQHMLASGLTDAREVQEEMIQDLRERRVRWVVEWKGLAYPVGFEARNPKGSRLLDDYLDRCFREVATFGDYTVKIAVPAAESGSRQSPPSCPESTDQDGISPTETRPFPRG